MKTLTTKIPRIVKLTLFAFLVSMYLAQSQVSAGYIDTLREQRNSAKMNPLQWVAGKGENPGMLGNVAAAVAFAAVGECAECPSATTMMSTSIAWMHGSMPASSELALKDWGDSLGIVKPAYAQGTGFNGLRNVKLISEVLRNVMLVGYILIFLAVGFMIMFRFKIDPRTVVSIQNALPRLVLTFFLVWLAYPISGLLIDLMYVASFFFFGLFQATGMDLSGFRDHFQGETVMQFWYFGQGFEAAWRPASSVAHIIAQVLGGGILGSTISGIAWVLAWAIIAVAILFAVFRLFFSLVMSYIMIIFGVIFAPLWIGVGGLPIQNPNLGFGGWLRHMLGHLAAFPVAAGLFIMARFLMVGVGGQNVASEGWVAPLIGAGYGPAVISGLVGLGMILLTPVVVQMTKDFFKSPEFKYMAAIQQGLGTGQAIVTAPVGVPFSIGASVLPHFIYGRFFGGREEQRVEAGGTKKEPQQGQ